MSGTGGPASGRVRIVRVIARLNVGGPARHVALLNAGMDPDRFRSWLVTGTENPGEGSLRDYAVDRGVEPLVVPEMLGQSSLAPRDAVALGKLVALIRRIRPHVVHTHTAKAGFLGRVAARAARVPVVVHTYHGHVLSGYFGRAKTNALRMMERGLAALSDRLIAVSDCVRDDLVALGVARSEKFSVVPLGLDLAPMFCARARYRGALRAELGVAPESPMVGIVGRLFPIKNHALFLNAAARLAAVRPDVRYVVVGDGVLRSELEDLARRRELAGRVFFTGWRHDLAAIYADLDVLVVSSRNEGTPVSAIEAMAAGCAVVATRVGGLPDLIDDGRTGILVAADDPGAMATAVGSVLTDTDASTSMRAEARVDVERRFMASRLVQDMQSLYLELLAAKGLTFAGPPRRHRTD